MFAFRPSARNAFTVEAGLCLTSDASPRSPGSLGPASSSPRRAAGVALLTNASPTRPLSATLTEAINRWLCKRRGQSRLDQRQRPGRVKAADVEAHSDVASPLSRGDRRTLRSSFIGKGRVSPGTAQFPKSRGPGCFCCHRFYFQRFLSVFH